MLGQGSSWHQAELSRAATTGWLLRAKHSEVLGSRVPEGCMRLEAFLLDGLPIHPAWHTCQVSRLAAQVRLEHTQLSMPHGRSALQNDFRSVSA